MTGPVAGTDSSPAPQEQAVGSGVSAMDADAINPTWFIPAGTQDNYAQMARDQAALRGVEPRQVMQELADAWEALHERQPLDGYDHLAAWGRDFDPAVGGPPSGLAVLQARVIESARRDPYQAVIGDQAAVEQGVAAQRSADEAAAGLAAAPSVDPASGFLPNAGPLSIPPDVMVGPEGGQVAQGDPSPGVETPDGAADAPSPSTGSTTTATATDTTTSDTPAPAPSKSTARNGGTSTTGSGVTSSDSGG